MKKLDKLIISAFLGPFFLTFVVVVFILLTQHMLKYFDDIVGKGLGWEVISQLLFYFAIFMTPVAMPLAVLLSSLMTFGNLGEHFELTAIKSAGISLLRTLFPIFSFVLLLTGFAFYSNNYMVPKAALKAYSLLYDIKQKKPALDLKEGAFYNGIPGFSIKVNKKYPDGITIKDVIIYNHTAKEGNKEVTLADSGRMSTFMDERYLKFQLFDGRKYEEYKPTSKKRRNRDKPAPFGRYSFKESTVIMDLSSFDLKRTKEELFARNRIMRNLRELVGDEDSIRSDVNDARLNYFESFQSYMSAYQFRESPIGIPNYLAEYRKKRDSLDRIKFNVPSEVSEAAVKEDTVDMKKENEVKGVQKQDSTKKSKKKQTEVEKEIEKRKKKTLQILENEKQYKPLKKYQQAKVTNEKEMIADGEIDESDEVAELPSTDDAADSTLMAKSKSEEDIIKSDSAIAAEAEEREKALAAFFANKENEREVLNTAVNQVRQIKSKVTTHVDRLKKLKTEIYIVQIQWHKIISNSLACIVMFLIGAPLGAIIKRGGLGMPVLLSIIFFIVFYVINMTGEKWAKQGAISVIAGMWAANYILLPFGLFFLRQARNDARLFDSDFYNVFFSKVKDWLKSSKT